MHGLARSGAAAEVEDFDLNSGDLVQFGHQLFDDDITVKGGVFDLLIDGVVQDRNGEPRGAGIGPILPRDRLNLDLTNGVFGRSCTAGVGIQAAIAGKGKGRVDARMLKDDILNLAHQPVLFLKAQVAAGQHIDDGLLRLRFDKKFNAVVVVDKVDERCADKDKNGPRHNQRHHRIAYNRLHQASKGRALIACAHTATTVADNLARQPLPTFAQA